MLCLPKCTLESAVLYSLKSIFHSFGAFLADSLALELNSQMRKSLLTIGVKEFS